jgi:hypothetical protein
VPIGHIVSWRPKRPGTRILSGDALSSPTCVPGDARARPPQPLPELSVILSLFRCLGFDRKSPNFGVWAAPAGQKTHPTAGPRSGPEVGFVFWPAGRKSAIPGRPPNPRKINKLRSAQARASRQSTSHAAHGYEILGMARLASRTERQSVDQY